MATANGAGVIPTGVSAAVLPPLRRIAARTARALSRLPGRVAEQAQLRSRFELASELGDHVEARVTGRQLARGFAWRDTELDRAVEFALQTLSRGDEPELRNEVVGWLEALGEPARAAAELRRFEPTPDVRVAAAVLLRVGILHARAGDPHGAREALEEAAALDPSNALALELLGSMAWWAPEALPPRVGAEAYVHAARRRAATGDVEAELENLFRAFELDPRSPLAAASLVAVHAAHSRPSAADEVLRMHATALASTSEAEAVEVHRQRRLQALERGDFPRALAAALDEGLDAVFEGPDADAFDDLLVRAGAFEVLAARLEVRAEQAASPSRGRRVPSSVQGQSSMVSSRRREAPGHSWAEVGRLLSGPLAAPERAVEAYGRSIAADANNLDALHTLRALGQKTESSTWMVEGLVRAAMGAEAYGAPPDVAARIVAARVLAQVAGETSDALLAWWALGVVVALDPSDERAAGARSRWNGEARDRDEELDAAERALDGLREADRPPALAVLARLLTLAVGRSRRLASVLAELANARPEDDGVFVDALRAAERVSDFEEVTRLCKQRRARGAVPPRTLLALVGALRRAGDLREAVAASAAGLFDACTPWAYSVAWITASAAGDRAMRARSIAALAPSCGATVVSALAAVAAEELLMTGDVVAARRAAEQACRADAHDARSIRILASVLPPAEGHVAKVALERAAAIAGPTAALCRRLAHVLEDAGDVAQATSWARRAVALRPGDAGVAQLLLDHATRAGDVEALADAVGWLLTQPFPARLTAERVAPALTTLGARAAKRAASLAGRALDVLGPRHAVLRVAVEAVADAAHDDALHAKVVERWLAAGAPAAERGPLLLTLAARYVAVGNVELELSAYVRAARAGVDLAPVSARIESLRRNEEGAVRTVDTELALLEVHAELQLDEGRTNAAATAFRELGAAFWDTADDRSRGVQAWLRAAALDSARGYGTLRRDLVMFAGAGYAADCLAELVEREGDHARAGMIATEAARAASDSGAHARAVTLARTALERYPSHAEALAIAEQACEHIGRVQEMSPMYDAAARGALGRFGRRAAHHRAARFFEGRVPMLALKHAAQAFLAVPSEGTTLALLARAADGASRRSVAVRTVEHVAELSKSRIARAGWLLRAASLTARDLEGARKRVDLLLKATVLSATPDTLTRLAVAGRELVSLAPDDQEAVAVRLERAFEALAKKLAGPDDARIALTFAEIALDVFSDAAWAWRALEKALAADADVDEYARLMPFAGALARADMASEALARVVAATDKPFSNAGVALLRLVGVVARARGDGSTSARAYVKAVEKDPENDDSVVEADAAVVANPEPALVERLAKKVAAFRLSQALLAVATRRSTAGDDSSAISALERAYEVAPSDLKDAIGAELRKALASAGRAEDALVHEIATRGLSVKDRALRWDELADLRERRGDVAGATDALLRAATDEPTAARWAAVERIAELSGRDHVRVQALQGLALQVDDDARLSVQKRLARAEGARGSLAAAEQAWHEVLVFDPNDTEADVAIEALLVAHASYDDLATHLGRRAERLVRAGGEKEMLRAVRLRRAAILEQRLGRLEGAASELEQVLLETPNHASALRWLADLYERAGNLDRAGSVLEKIAATTTDPAEQETVAARRVRGLVVTGDVEGARRVLAPLLERAVSTFAVATARVEIARAAQDPSELGSALEALARTSPDDARARSEMLVEAAQAAARAGDTEASLSRAKNAARLAPDVAATQLFARGLEYRLRGAGSLDEARATIVALSRLDDGEALEPEDLALRSFLLAEAEDVVAPGAGERTLRDCLGRIGPQALVALGLAERALATGRPEEALHFFGDAIHGNLLGLRRAGAVALAAADAGERTMDTDAVLRFLDEAVRDPETQAEALRRLRLIPFVARDVAHARRVLRGLADALEGGAKAEILAQLARALFESVEPSERIEADRTLREAIESAPPELAMRLREQLGTFRSRQPPASPLPPFRRAPSSGSLPVATEVNLPTPPPDWPASALETASPREATQVHAMAIIGARPIAGHGIAGPGPGPAGLRVEDRATASAPASHPNLRDLPKSSAPEPSASAPVATTTVSAKSPLDPQAPTIAETHVKPAAGLAEEAERLLAAALHEGSLAAADALDERFAGDPSRSTLLVKIRRRAVELRPGDTRRLVALRDAARLDQNPNYVRAIDHVLRAFDSAQGPMPPPPLTAQNNQPGMLSLLTQHSREVAGESFGVVLEDAHALFAKAAATSQLVGLERVMPGPITTLARLYEIALRLLDPPRFALLHRRGSGSPALTVVLSWPPSAILTGDANEDGSDLRWMLGHALASVLPQNALPLGLPESDARLLWDVLLQAFGPPTKTKMDRAHADLAERLWQTLTPRAQRRLKELLDIDDATPFELAVERARQSGRRVGMFLTGDFAHAARTVVAEHAALDVTLLEQPGGLASLCAALPALADLFRLAIRPEYADARWHVLALPSARLPFATGGLPPV